MGANEMKTMPIASFGIVIWLATCGQAADSAIRFESVPAGRSGIAENRGISFGGAWGDVNGDGFPDLWLNNHLGRPVSFYLNNRDGTFKDVSNEIFVGSQWADHHGPAFVDFDNDGDQDLVSLIGGGAGQGTEEEILHVRLYVNQQGKLEDRYKALGVGYPLARGRGPYWLDFNRDGLLDLVIGAIPRRIPPERPAVLFQQRQDHTFEDSFARTGFRLLNAPHMIYSDFSRDGQMDIMTENAGGLTVYDASQLPFADITPSLAKGLRAGNDMVSVDSNNDLQPDLYITRGGGDRGGMGERIFLTNDVCQISSNKVIVRVSRWRFGADTGVQFESPGEITFKLSSVWQFLKKPESIYIGAQGIHPGKSKFLLSEIFLTYFDFVLSPDDPKVAGIFPHTPGKDAGVYIGYDPALKRWQISASNLELIGIIEGAKPVSKLTALGFDPDPRPEADTLLINTPHGLVDQSEAAGINKLLIRGASVVAGDFDNDMDQDLFIVASRSVVNTPDILLENQGDGTFVSVPNAGGAVGSTMGIGNFVITADYDLDGFLDLLVANGGQDPDLIAVEGGYELFHNQGNRNHWLGIDLQGVRSNRDGIGAQVFVTAGGKTQLREQNGGIHVNTQNHARLHFGLGTNAVAQELLIKWPSGTQQRIKNLKADHVLKVVESGD